MSLKSGLEHGSQQVLAIIPKNLKFHVKRTLKFHMKHIFLWQNIIKLEVLENQLQQNG